MAPASMARHREHSTVSGGGQAGGAAVAADAAVSLPMPPVAALVAAAAPLHVIAAVCRRGGVAAAAAAVAGRRRRLPPALMWSSLPGVPLPYTYRRASHGRAHCVRGISCTRASSARAVRAHVSDRVAPASEETNGKAEASREREPRPMPKLEQAEPDFSEPSRFSALSVDDGDDN